MQVQLDENTLFNIFSNWDFTLLNTVYSYVKLFYCDPAPQQF